MIKESLCYGDYEIGREKQSEIDPTKTYYVETGVQCPKCKTILQVIEYGETRECVCGLEMTRWGNSLDCELE